MGNDEHGPAYPEPDDAEYEHFKREYGIDDEKSVPWPVALVGWATLVAVLVYMAWPLH